MGILVATELLPIGILVSGRGSNILAIADTITAGGCRPASKWYIGDRPGALALSGGPAAGV